MTTAGRLRVVLLLDLTLVGGPVLVGWSAHSLGVLAEGADYLADAAAIAVSLLAMALSGRVPTQRHPRGYPKATTMAAGINAGWLLVLSVLVAAGAADRLLTGTHPVHGLPVLIISGTAAAVMFGGALILARDLDGDLIMRAVSLDTAADAAAAAGVAATGGVILATGRLFWLDPFVALIIALVIGYQAVRLLREITAALGSQQALPR